MTRDLKGVSLDLSEVVGEYRFHGVTRSGTHILALWIASMLSSDRFAYFDAVYLQQGFPCSGLPVGGLIDVFRELPFCARPKFTGYQLENSDLTIASQTPFATDFGKDVLILRDPFNLLASKLAFVGKYTGKFSVKGVDVPTMAVWKVHAAEFLNPRVLTKVPLIRINFDTWALSASYRLHLSRMLHRENGKRPSKVSPRGGGSSFTGTLPMETPEPVMDRWTQALDDPRFHEVFDDNEILELAQEIWPNLVQRYLNRRNTRPVQ